MTPPDRWGARYQPAPIPPSLYERVGRALTRLTLRHYFLAEHIDPHHIPAHGPVILVPNHPTMLDPFLVAFGTRRWVTWLAFDEAPLQWAVAAFIMRIYEAIPVNLQRPRPSSIKAAYATLARDRVLGVFFEGERSFGYTLNRPLKTGAARMALRTDAHLVPVSITGGRRAWPRERALPLPRKLVIRYHPPIHAPSFLPDLPFRERARALTVQLADTIEGALPPDGSPRRVPDPQAGYPGRGGNSHRSPMG